MNKVDAINKIFDKQIKENPQFAHSHEMNKELFNLTLNFTIEDWKKFRTKKYWDKMKNLSSDFERKDYTLTCVKFYLENIK
jgi:hypothetical protein